MAGLDGRQQVFSGIVDARKNVRIALGIGCPEHHHFVQCVLGFEVTVLVSEGDPVMESRKHCLPDVLADFLHVGKTSFGPFQDIICAIFLVGSDEIRIVNAWKGRHGGHLL